MRVSPVDAIVIVAMDDEAAPFLDRASSVGEPRTVGNAVYRDITLAGRAVLLVRSGIGLVNAAGAATSAILATATADATATATETADATGATDASKPEPLVISAGTAGGVDDSVHVGDVVVGSEYITIDADARAFGYVLGQVPRMPPLYRADTSWVDEVPEPDVQRLLPELPNQPMPPALRTGLIVSSDAFVSTQRAERIRIDFAGALATDMESLAIAQTCHVYGRQFVSVRGISDLCGPASNTDFLTHVDDAAARSADVVVSLLERTP